MINLETKVNGVTYEGRQGILASLRGDEPCRVEQEPDNPYDPNALKVMIATDTGIEHVGYIPRDLAQRIAPLLDGEAVMVSIARITGGFEYPDGSLANFGLVLSIQLEENEL